MIHLIGGNGTRVPIEDEFAADVVSLRVVALFLRLSGFANIPLSTKIPRVPLYFFFAAAIAGSSSLHSGHHVAQNSITTGLFSARNVDRLAD